MGENSGLRLAMLGILFIGLFAGLFTRLWYLQVVIETEAQSRAESNLLRQVFRTAPRGQVLDRNGNVLIDNRLVNEVIIDKFELFETLPSKSARESFAIKLAREISAAGRLIKAVDIEEALADQKYGPFDRVPIATDVPERFSILIGEREDDFPGVRVQKTTVRYYPYGSLGSHILGYVGPIFTEDLELLENDPKLYQPTDVIGREGVEATFETILRGTPGRQVIEVDALGDRVRTVSETKPVPGNNVRLTIDINLQAMVERELADGIQTARTRNDESDEDKIVPYKAPGGAMVLLDPDGSRILAMASYPTYDQRVFARGITDREFEILKDPGADAPLLNRASAARYAPGSTFKLITAYAALDSGLLGDRGFLRRTQFLVDEGIWRVPGECFGAGCTIENAGQKPLGDVDLAASITESSNIYFGQLGYQFNVRPGFQAQQLIDTAFDFGYAQATDSITGAYRGEIPVPDSAGETANLAVGQGLMLATPLQMANSYAVLANRGKYYLPMLGEESIDAATGETLTDFPERLEGELYMPDEWYVPLIQGLRGVTANDKGTAYDAFEFFPLDTSNKPASVATPPLHSWPTCSAGLPTTTSRRFQPRPMLSS